MDDTTQSRTSDVGNGATRKRRSSILKSQRPPRTPFCELEFNVCTPTDTTKSRRVSFSRRTGVAEFATNEATTTWKNFYEEHNKSLESSGNDSEMNHGKQPVAHLGKRIFDEQFEECEAFDFMGTLNPGMNINASINNVNFTRLETTETKLSAPQSNFELSALTETQSRLFGDNLAITCTSEISGRIDVNFSAIQQIPERDDLDEIQKDLQRNSNIVCPGPFTEQNMSEYIEVDLNMTHVAIPNDESDMSITDTIHSPKVQDVSKSCSIDKKVSINNKDWVADKENIVLNPYVAPRESVNFAVTEMPEEVLVFDGKRLIVETENPNKQSLRPSAPSNPPDRAPQRKTIVLNCNDDLPNFVEDSQLSKNQSCFVGFSESQSFDVPLKPTHPRLDETQNNQRTVIFGDDLDDISITQAVPTKVANEEKRRTIIYNDDIGNISITQALPSNIVDKEKRRTIVYENDNDNISFTQAVPGHVIIPTKIKEKRNTIVFEHEACDISMTQAIPTNIVSENNGSNRRTIILEDGAANKLPSQTSPNIKKKSKQLRRTIVSEDDSGNISVTHSVTSSSSNDQIPPIERRTTVVFANDNGNVSVTQALPSNILTTKNLNTTTYGNDCNISMTQALPANILQGANTDPNKRRTVVFGNDTGNLSITQAVTNRVIQSLAQQQLGSEESNALIVGNQISKQEDAAEHLEENTGNKRRTIVFQNDAADISITQAVPVRQVIDNVNSIKKHEDALKAINETLQKESNFINSINCVSEKQNEIYKMTSDNLDSQNCNKTEATVEGSNKEKTSYKRRTVVFDNDNADISLTQAVSVNKVIDATQLKHSDLNNAILSQESSNKRRTVVFENDDADISMTQAVSVNKVLEAIQLKNIEANIAILPEEASDKRKTVVFENEDANISMTQGVPLSKVMEAIQLKNSDENNTILSQSSNKRRTVVFENEDADISMTQAVPLNKVIEAVQEKHCNLQETHLDLPKNELDYKRRTVVFENEEADISMTRTVTTNQVIDAIQTDNTALTKMDIQKDETTNKRKTVIFENDDADISMTQAAPVNQILDIIQKSNQNTGETNETLQKEESTKRRTVIFENDEADISMTQVAPANQIIDIIQDYNHTIDANKDVLQNEEPTTKRKTIIFENDEADISMTQTAPINKIIDAISEESHNFETINTVKREETKSKRKTVVFENEEADISMTQTVPANQIIDTTKKQVQNNLTNKSLQQTLNNEKFDMHSDDSDSCLAKVPTLTNIFKDLPENNPIEFKTVTKEIEEEKSPCDILNNKTQIVKDDDEKHVSMARSISSTLVKNRITIVESVESLLENKELLMQMDKLSDEIEDNGVKMTSDCDVSMSELSDEETDGQKMDTGENNVHVTRTNHESFGKCDKSHLNAKEHSAMLSKPIPSELEIIQELMEKSRSNDATKCGVLKDVLVYQSSANTHNLLLTTDKGDSEDTREDMEIEEKKDYAESMSITKSEVKARIKEELFESHNISNYDVAENSKVRAVKTVNFKQNNSILKDLLDMSESSFDCTEKKDICAVTSFIDDPPKNQADVKESKDSGMFYITKDSDGKSSSSDTQSSIQEIRQIQGEAPLCIEYKDDKPSIVIDLQSKLSTMNDVINQSQAQEFAVDEESDDKTSLDMTRRKSGKSFKMANDTKELLEMLSDFTDRRVSRNMPLEELPELDDDSETRLSIENKVEETKYEPPRFNRTLKRQSVVLSREDLLNNLSMASAALQMPRSDLDDSDDIEVKDTPNTSTEHRKSVRLSTEVVKTLQFDDDSMSEANQSPLKKTAFGEVSYMKHMKSNVIPGYVTNAADGIKELMDDLVKPMCDAQPFTESLTNKIIAKDPSMCSTQIQANLLTSSQVDLQTDLYSTTESVPDLDKFSSADLITQAMDRSMTRAIHDLKRSTPLVPQSAKSSEVDFSSDEDKKSIETTIDTEEMASKANVHTQKKSIKSTVNTQQKSIKIAEVTQKESMETSEHQQNTVKSPVPKNPVVRQLEEILIFDQNNPLNNVLLLPTPAHAIDVHKYDPIKKVQEESQDVPEKEQQIKRVTNQYRVEFTSTFSVDNADKSDAQSIYSSLSKPMSVDQFTEPETNKLRDVEINTDIVMRRNDELLEASSSLTLVNNAINRRDCSNNHVQDASNSPVKIIYQVEEPPLTKDSDFTSTDETDRPAKSKKRIYSPSKREKHKNCTISSLDLTPKPVNKMQKLSTSPFYAEPIKLPAERDKSVEKSPGKGKSNKVGTTITIQQLTTMVHVEPPVQNKTDSSTTEPRSAVGSQEVLALPSSEIISSFTSSNNLRDETERCVSDTSKLGWLPRSISTSRSLMGSDDSTVDVAAVINSMPFMGTQDCQWDCVRGDVWSILLLHSRLRLTIRFATADRVRPNTPVLNVELDTLHQDKKNPIAYLCVVYAGELMRHHMSRGCDTGGDCGKLLRRLAAAAKLAAAWARAMHDARARLAYSLTTDGRLALKVANTSYRAVWEVSMTLELVVEAPHAAPWPRAGGVRVARVLPSAAPRAPALARAVRAAPHDWSHAPRTVWKVFRYLRHKKRDDDV